MIILVPLKEKLIPVDRKAMDLLYAQMKADLEFSKLMTIPARSLPRYRFLVLGELPRALRNSSLLDIIKITIESSSLNYNPFFSMTGSKVTAFFAYRIESNIITDIKTFSLQDSPNGVLAKDLIFFIKDNRSKYYSIEWDALKENPANDQYLKVLRMFTNPNAEPDIEGHILHYRIPGLKKA